VLTPSSICHNDRFIPCYGTTPLLWISPTSCKPSDFLPLRSCHPTSSPVTECVLLSQAAGSSFHQITELTGSPKFLQFPCNIIPRPQTPKEQSISLLYEINHAVFQQMKTVDLFDVEYYGAQYLHFRCGLISPSSWLHLLRYLHKCNFQ